MGKSGPMGGNVLLTGFTSFFTDISSEMIYPLLQAFIKSLLRTQAALVGPVLGVIEGTAESTASLLKVFSGYYSDRWSRRKPLVISGYSLSMISKLLYLAPYLIPALIARLLDRVGKGIRTAPRDALIAESVSPRARGRAFGFQRAMDFGGAFIGTVISYFLVRHLFKVRGGMEDPKVFFPVFIAAVVPAFLGVIFLLFLKDIPRGEKPRAEGKRGMGLSKLSTPLKLFFVSQLVFTLGNSSNQFLLLRSGDLGFALHQVLLLYIVFNLTSSLLSTLFGSLSDRIGRKGVLIAGYLLYSAVYMAFGFIGPGSRWLLWVFWPLYGVYYALTEGAEKAFVSDCAPSESKGTVLGLYNTIVGIGLFPASLLAGILFRLKPYAPFIFGGGTAVVSVFILGVFVRVRRVSG